MKALSVKQRWAAWIAEGIKTIETRTWPTNYRGELLIVASKQPDGNFSGNEIEGKLLGKALCVAELIDCRRMTAADTDAAMCHPYPGAWAWVLTNIRPVEPFSVRGRLKLYDVDNSLIVISG